MVQAEPGPAPVLCRNDAGRVRDTLSVNAPSRYSLRRRGGDEKDSARQKDNKQHPRSPLRMLSGRAEFQIRINSIHSFPRLLASSFARSIEKQTRYPRPISPACFKNNGFSVLLAPLFLLYAWSLASLVWQSPSVNHPRRRLSE